MKKNNYISLIILCILGLILVKIYTSMTIPAAETARQIFDKKEIMQRIMENITDLTNPAVYVLNLLGLFYLLAFLAGLGNLVFFCIRSFMKKSLTVFTEEKKQFPLSWEKTCQLVFWILLVVLLSHLAEIGLYIYRKEVNVVQLALGLNLALEAAIIVVILNFLKSSFLGFNMKTKHFLGLIQIYTAMLPLLMLASVLVDKLGVKPTFNPAIDLMFSLKDKHSIHILLAQVVVFGPVAEELFFRGVVYKILRNRYSFIFSAAATSLFFAVIHGIPQATLPLFVISMSLCYLYEKTQNIASVIVFHSLFNSVNIALVLAIRNVIS